MSEHSDTGDTNSLTSNTAWRTECVLRVLSANAMTPATLNREQSVWGDAVAEGRW